MTFEDLASSYLWKAKSRRKILNVLLEDKNYSDVVRESQSIVELCLKGVLRRIGIDPPKWHDVSPKILECRLMFPEELDHQIDVICKISSQLRKEREISFYGDVDMIPTQIYHLDDAKKAIMDVDQVISFAELVIGSSSKE